MRRTLLIVDDVRTNLLILKEILKKEYRVIEAENGEEALTILQKSKEEIAAVLLDLFMPVKDGFDVISEMRADHKMAYIPIIVTTAASDNESEIKALRLGANDYITKPYIPTIILQRVRNMIHMSETSAAINEYQRDRLTGLYNRNAFIEKTSAMIQKKEPGSYVMGCFDIDNFKVINDLYGTEKGDDVLRYIARVCQAGFQQAEGILCHMDADRFAACYPKEYMGSDFLKEFTEKAAALDGSIPPVSFRIGRYVIDDLSLSVSAMYDRASLARMSVKDRYDKHIALFDESMRDTLLSEQKIVTEMSSALKSGQFEVWFQPQYNHLTEELIGAEALVRWRHPEQGLIPPDRFIPIFEKNGFVYEMDKYVWEHTCMFLHTWIKEKRNPLPISVNISRYDIFQDDMVQILLDLLEKYEIPVALLRLEITESAFAQSSRRVVAVAKELVKHGFTVEIDDFGSGYSSLNTLKDVPAQIIKLDMKFFSASDDYQRGGSIVESMVRMAKWLNMAVIAEGVETVKQADFLKTIGCYYIQGYLYAKPMPVEDYVKLASQGSKQPHLQHVETVANLDSNAFWDPNSMDTLIFNSYIGGACIMEYCRGRIELLRANDKYLEMIGGTGMTLDDLLKLDWAKYMSVESSRHMDRIVANAMQADSEETGEFIFIDLPGCAHKTYLRSTLRVIARTGYRYLLYCTSENITAQRNAEQKQSETMDQLRFLENVAHNLLTQQDPEAGIEAILDQMLGFFESSRICIYEFDFVHRYAINTYEQHTDSVQDLPASLAKITMHSPDKWKKPLQAII